MAKEAVIFGVLISILSTIQYSMFATVLTDSTSSDSKSGYSLIQASTSETQGIVLKAEMGLNALCIICNNITSLNPFSTEPTLLNGTWCCYLQTELINPSCMGSDPVQLTSLTRMVQSGAFAVAKKLLIAAVALVTPALALYWLSVGLKCPGVAVLRFLCIFFDYCAAMLSITGAAWLSGAVRLATDALTDSASMMTNFYSTSAAPAGKAVLLTWLGVIFTLVNLVVGLLAAWVVKVRPAGSREFPLAVLDRGDSQLRERRRRAGVGGTVRAKAAARGGAHVESSAFENTGEVASVVNAWREGAPTPVAAQAESPSSAAAQVGIPALGANRMEGTISQTSSSEQHPASRPRRRSSTKSRESIADTAGEQRAESHGRFLQLTDGPGISSVPPTIGPSGQISLPPAQEGPNSRPERIRPRLPGSRDE